MNEATANRSPRTGRRRLLTAVAAALGVILTAAGAMFTALGTSTAPPAAAALDVQRVELPAGSAYVFTLGVMTAEENGTTLRFRSGQTYDFVVRQDGREIWRWSAGRAFHQAMFELPLKPGQLAVFVHVWDGRDGTGSPVVGDVTVEASVTSATAIEAPPVQMYVETDKGQ